MKKVFKVIYFIEIRVVWILQISRKVLSDFTFWRELDFIPF